MATVAEFTIDADQIPLGGVLSAIPEYEIELERVIPTSDAIIPYLWLRGVEIEEIEEVLESNPEITGLTFIDGIDDEHLVRISWNPSYQGVVKAIAETDVTLLTGTGTPAVWTFQVRGDDRQAISVFQTYCRDHGIPITLTALHAVSRAPSGLENELTAAQHEALLLAYHAGYFQTPRQATLAEIAEELEITGQSLGARLRRGTHRLIGSTLVNR